MQQQNDHQPDGFLRIKQILPDLVPIAPSTWWAGVKSGKFPQPIKLGTQITVWRASDIRDFIDSAK